ncbi:amino acid adenylation domain-containing protein [Bradyrhizobium sp. USDA 4506]
MSPLASAGLRTYSWGEFTMSIETLSVRERNNLVRRLRRQSTVPAGDSGQRTASVNGNITRAQSDIWLASKINPDVPLWWLPTICNIFVPIDVGMFRICLRTLAQSREALRSHVQEKHGATRLECSDTLAPEIDFIDFSTAADATREFQAWLQARKSGPPEPTVRLFDTALLKLSDAHYVWFLNVHHLVADGWSLQLLIADMADAYGQAAGGVEQIVVRPRPRYDDLAGLTKSDSERRNMAYWERVGRDEYTAFNFFGGESPTFSRAAAVRRVSQDLPHDVVQLARRWIDDRSTECRVRFSILDAALSALGIYLSKAGGCERVSVGVPLHNRTARGMREVIGPFADVYPVRFSLTPDDNAEAVLQRVRLALEETYAHVPSPIPRTPDSRLYDCELNYISYEPVSFCGKPAQLETVHPGHSVQPLVIQIIAHRSIGQFTLNLDCRVDYFSESQQMEILQCLTRIVASLLESPKAPIGSYDIVSSSQQAQIRAWNDTQRSSESYRPVTADIDVWSETSPQNVALQTDGEAVTYFELRRRSDAIVEALKREGVAPQEIVGVCFERSVEMVISIVAVLKAGAAYLPLDPSLPTDRLKYMVEDAGARIVLTTRTLREAVGEIAPEQIRVVDHWWAGEECSTPSQAIDPKQGAYLIYTSGSTGQPKGVLVEHAGLFNRLDWMRRQYSLGPEDCFLQKTPFGFDVSVWELLLPLMCGARMVIAKPGGHRDPQYLAQTIEQYGVTALHFVPPMLREFLKSNGVHAFPALRHVFCSGDVLAAETMAHFQAAFGSSVRLHNLYGPTEASIDVTAWECTPLGGGTSVPIGRPIDNTCTYILDQSMSLLPVGIIGELYLGGIGLARGYLRKPALTAASFLPNPFSGNGDRLYRTGDLARYLPDGNIEFVGRRDHQVKVRGNRIELSEIEQALVAHPSVRQVVVLARRDEVQDQCIWAYVVKDEGNDTSAATLKHYIRTRLPDYMLPAQYAFLSEIPLTHNGKVDRKALLGLSASGTPEEKAAYEAPVTATETFLCYAWEQVLGRRPIGITENFFDIGGHSLLVNDVFARIQDRYGSALSFAELFQNPRIAQLAALIEQRSGPSDPSEAFEIRPVSRQLPMPLSQTQERFWYLSQFEDVRALYNMTSTILLRGKVDASALREAVRFIQVKHEILRANFLMEDGRQRVAISEKPRCDLEVIARSLENNEALEENAARNLAQSLSERAFDLATDPLLRCVLIHTIDGKSLLVISTHHIVADGWSMMILFRDLVEAYNSIVRQSVPTAPAKPSLQYLDFAHWQARWMGSSEAVAERDYWKKRLAGVEIAEFPRDKPRPPIQTHRGAILEFSIPADVIDGLRQTAEICGASLFTVFVTALIVLLSKYTGKRDVTLGTVVSGRHSKTLESMVGPLVNTLVVRSTWSFGTNVGELVRSVKRDVLEAFASQSLPFEKVVEACGIRPDSARTPLFQTMFAYQDIQNELIQVDNVSAEFLHPEQRIALFDMTFQIFPDERHFSGNMIYNSDLFDEATALQIRNSWLNILDALGASSESSVDQIDIVEKPFVEAATINGSNVEQGRADYRDPVAMFREATALYPRALSIVHGEEKLTYSDLNERSDRLASHLLAVLGTRPGDRVAICCERSIGFMVAVLGVLKAGAVYVPVDPSLPEERISYILSDSSSAAVIAVSKYEQRVSSGGVPIVNLDALDLESSIVDCKMLPLPASPDDLCYIVYTSGSTGYPKGVMVSHGGLANLIAWFQGAFDITQADIATQVLSASFDGFVLETWPYLTKGGCIHIVGREVLLDRENFRDYLSANRVSIAFLPTALVSHFMALPWKQPHFLRAILTGGDRLILTGAERADIPLFNLYGPTEGTVVATYGRVAPGRGSPSIGRPIANTEIYILDEELRRVPAGALGEIYIGGAGVARGYAGRAALTAASFIPNPFVTTPGARIYRTGDIARHAEDGSIAFVSRRDDQISINGYRVEIQEIESRIAMLREVRQILVLYRHAGSSQGQLVGFYSCHDGEQIAPSSVISFAAEFLPDYMVPRKLVCLPELPLTASGKYDVTSLMKQLDEIRNESSSVQPPFTDDELLLATMWEEVLSVSHVGVHDDFYLLGGTSMSLIALQNKVKSRTGLHLPLPALMRATTIRQQALLWKDSRAKSSAASSLVLLSDEGDRGTPIVLVHPPGGDVACYRELAALLGVDRKIWAIQDVRQYSTNIVALRTEEWIDMYASEVARQFNGPIVLAGWSGGGLLCCELASKLRAMGRIVRAIVLLDSRIPIGLATGDKIETEIHYGTALALSILSGREVEVRSKDVVAAMSASKRLEYVAMQLQKAKLTVADSADDMARKLIDLLREHVVAIYGLSHGPIEGPVIHLKTLDLLDPDISDDGQQELWIRRVSGNYREIPVSGNHLTMLRRPNVGQVAESILTALATAENQP